MLASDCELLNSHVYVLSRPHRFFFLDSLTMMVPDDIAFQQLPTDLAGLDRQIAALLKKQDELLQKLQLEASSGAFRSPVSS